MANYSTLKAAVADVVKTNGSQAITGANLQSVLLSIINSIGGGGYIFAGVATPSTSVGTPDQNVFYLTGAGTFANMGTSTTVPVGSIGIFKYNGSWTSSVLDLGFLEQMGIINLNQLNNKADAYTQKGLARIDVPEQLRKKGLMITYMYQYADDGWFTEQYVGDDVADWVSGNWLPLTNTFDDVPMRGSKNLVDSGSIYVYSENANSIADIAFRVYPLKQGSLNITTGEESSSPRRVVTEDYIPSPFIISVNSGYNIARLSRFTMKNDRSKEYVNYTDYSGAKSLSIPDDGYVYRVVFSKAVTTDDILPTEDIIAKIDSPYFSKSNDIGYGLVHGYYWSLTGTAVTDIPVSNSGYGYCEKIKVREGDAFSLTTMGGAGSARAYALTDDIGNVVSVASPSALLINEEILVVQDGYLYVNCALSYSSSFRLIKKNAFGYIDSEINGGRITIPEILTTYSNSALDDSGNILPNINGYEVKEYATKANHVYHVITRVASSGAVWGRCFVYKLKEVNTRVGYVPLAFQGYGTDCDVEFPCDGSFTKIRVLGITGVQQVAEIGVPVYSNMVGENGWSVTHPDVDGRLPIMQSASCVAMIRKWGFIGASYESGAFEYKVNGQTKFMQDYDVSFPQILMRMNGCDGYCFSGSGESAKQWCTRTVAPVGDVTWNVYDREWNNGNSRVATELKQAYVIELGSNDMSQGQAVGNLSTDVDLSDYNNNADTYAGWICGVIQRVLSVNPKAFFFVCTIRRYYNGGSTGARFMASDIVRQLPEFFRSNNITDRIYVLDLEKYGMDWAAPANAAYYNGTHPTALGYYYLACWFNTYIDDCIKHNMLAFNEVQFVGTDKHYN